MMNIKRLLRLFQETHPELGVNIGNSPSGKLNISRFRDKDVDDFLNFDLGNNKVSASVTARGAIHRAMIFSAGVPVLTVWPGVWYSYNYTEFCDNTEFVFRSGKKQVAVSDKDLQQETSLIRGAFPLTATEYIGSVKA